MVSNKERVSPGFCRTLQLMESIGDSEIVHRGYEPLRCRSQSADKSDALQTLRARGRVSGSRVSVWSACVFSADFPRQTAIRWSGRFMEKALSVFRMHWDHEPGWFMPQRRRNSKT